MKVADLLESRQAHWQELEQLCRTLKGGSRRQMAAATLVRFSALYRDACADLALADAYQLPPGTVHYLHQLVGRAHSQLYRSRTFNVRDWFQELFLRLPQRLYADQALRLALLIFWGFFLLAAALAYNTPGFAEQVIGAEMITQLEDMYSEPPTGHSISTSGGMWGFYIYHNPQIGLQCFAFGLLLGIGGLFATIGNAAILGAVFGHMANTPQAGNFYQFVTAHGPFELTAIVLCAAAGMRLGFALIDTHGYTRLDSLRRAGTVAMPVAILAVLLFVLAACIEGFVSPSSAPYWAKASVAVLSAVVLLFYFVVLGHPRGKGTARPIIVPSFASWWLCAFA
jgi:uncharacterized membrane protein SpoIIM required for sporulation